MSQLNTVNNTDTVIDLNLNPNHLIHQPFSMDQVHDKYPAIKKEPISEEKEILKMKLRPDVSLTPKSGLIID